MKCYNHHDRDAFGVCRVCGKGLCLECMSQDKELGIYCKNNAKCNQYAKLITKIFDFQIRKKKIFLWIFLACIIAFFVCMLIVPMSP